MTAFKMLGNRREFFDYVDLALLRLAKIGRARLSGEAADHGFYEEFFTDLDVAVLYSGTDRRRRVRAEVMREAIADSTPTGGRLLDVGCGIGDNLAAIVREDFRPCGMEYSGASARVAARMLCGKADICNASATAIPFPDSSFDTVMCIEVLEHIPDHLMALREISRVTVNGGCLLMSVPYRYWFPSYFTLMGHCRHYTRSDIVSLLSECGFYVVRYLPNHPRWSRYANYCYVACRIFAMMGRAIGRRVSPTELRMPFSDKRLLDLLLDWFNTLKRREDRLDYSKLETSTFVLARKTTREAMHAPGEK